MPLLITEAELESRIQERLMGPNPDKHGILERRTECERCKGVGWYETGEKLESGDGWNEPYHWEWAEADCEECDGTGWKP